MTSHPPSLVTVMLAIAALIGVAIPGRGATTSCLACHADADMLASELVQIIDEFRQDVHAQAGLSCHDCHGGNPDPALAEDMTAAMDEDYAADPYRGAPESADVPSFCGRCHSDPTYMRRFKPDARIDQEREYWTSQHGEALRSGDLRVATCVSCHGTHRILRPTDPDSLVYPTRLAETCRTCHGDPQRMAGFTLPNGLPVPIDQYARWRQSVHAVALLEKEDLSAPTCNDCHGNHGATPPGLDSVAFVCGQCHGREAELFRGSPKHAAFEVHNGYLEDAGPEGCPACHEVPEPQAALTRIHRFGECTSCHDNHGIVRPTVGMLSPPPPNPCEICHQVPDSLASATTDEPAAIRESHETTKAELLKRADEEGLHGEALFNWLVDQALELPNHTLASADGAGDKILRPEFSRLWAKFRIGKTTFTYDDPTSGEPTEARVTRCDACHAAEPLLADEARGMEASTEIMGRMHELTALTARAERLILRARRGGVETRDALLEIDQAVDALIELEVLVHDFTLGEDSQFVIKQNQGLTHAYAGLEAAQEALDELAFRRRGLAVSLLFIVLVLLALALKIRQMSSRPSGA